LLEADQGDRTIVEAHVAGDAIDRGQELVACVCGRSTVSDELKRPGALPTEAGQDANDDERHRTANLPIGLAQSVQSIADTGVGGGSAFWRSQ
jgi:hypothetical protein